MVDDAGHQMVQIEYPGLPASEILQSVHEFYDAYYFRPKAAYRILRKAFFNNSERKRLYKDAKTFLKCGPGATGWLKSTRLLVNKAEPPRNAWQHDLA